MLMKNEREILYKAMAGMQGRVFFYWDHLHGLNKKHPPLPSRHLNLCCSDLPCGLSL